MTNQEIKIQPAITCNSDIITFWNHKGKQVSMTLEELIQAYNKASKQKETYWMLYQLKKVDFKVSQEKLKRTEELWEKGE